MTSMRGFCQMEARVAEYVMPAPGESAGRDTGPTKPQHRMDLSPLWARPEISNCRCLVEYATERALGYAKTVHDFDCECRGLDWASAIGERCDNPLLLIRFLPFDATEAVRRAAERRLRAWPN
jgi:hypothetical protein